MAITLIKGRPGAGKSYECVVHHILPSIKDGRKVVTNIPLNIDHFALTYGEKVRDLLEIVPFDFDGGQVYLSDPEDYKKYQEWKNDKGQGCLFVLDECHLLFPLSGRGKSHTDLAERQISFFSGHRHWGFDFIFLTQSDRKINRLLREDIEICIEVRKNRAMGDKSYRRYVFYYGDGKRSGLIEQDSRQYEDKFFSFYKSHTKSDGEVTEAKIKDMKKWHQHWGLRIPLLLIIVGVLFSVKNISHFFGEKTNPEPVPTVQHSSPKIDKPVKKPSLSTSFKGLPFGEFEIFIEGYSDSSYTDENGIYHIQKQVYFSGLNSSKFKIDLKLDDFYLAGYQVAVYGPCMVRLTYESSTKLVYCRGKEPDKDSSSLAKVQDIVSP
ncbi:zonular occludens toxin domain-containing protein [Vibrio cyclitrophicus]